MAETDADDFLEAGRKLFAVDCDFLWAAAATPIAAAGRAGNRLRRALERRQILAPQRADQPQSAGAHLDDAGAHAAN